MTITYTTLSFVEHCMDSTLKGLCLSYFIDATHSCLSNLAMSGLNILCAFSTFFLLVWSASLGAIDVSDMMIIFSAGFWHFCRSDAGFWSFCVHNHCSRNAVVTTGLGSIRRTVRGLQKVDNLPKFSMIIILVFDKVPW